MQRKRLEDMNLLDDFLFNAVMTFPGIGERLLTVIINYKFHITFNQALFRIFLSYFVCLQTFSNIFSTIKTGSCTCENFCTCFITKIQKIRRAVIQKAVPFLPLNPDPEIILCHSSFGLFYDHKRIIKWQIQIF